MNTCRFVKDVSENARGDAAHYRFDEPVLVPEDEWDDDTEMIPVQDIVVSTVEECFDHGERETMVFQANDKGLVVSFHDLAVIIGKKANHKNCINQFIKKYCPENKSELEA